MVTTSVKNSQITLPSRVLQESGLIEGDVLACYYANGEIRLIPIAERSKATHLHTHRRELVSGEKKTKIAESYLFPASENWFCLQTTTYYS